MNKNCLLKGVLALLSLCLISCQDYETASDDAVKIAYRPTFEAAVEQVMDADTKVYVDENLKILWHADDRVGLFDHYTYNQQYCFQGETGANAGTFSIVPNGDVVVGNELPAVYAVYPYDEGTAISNDGVLSLSLPAVQSYSERSFGPGTNTMISVTEEKYLLFKNLGGYLEIKLYGEDVTVSKIVLKGNNDEKIAGKATVTAPLGDVPIVEMTDEATTEVSLECATPVALGTTAEDYTEFWFVLPPTEFTQGFTITVYDDKGGHFEQSTEKPVSISRNNLSRMSPVEAQMTGPTISPNKYLTFASEGTTTISLKNTTYSPVLYYSKDGINWAQWDYSELSFSNSAPLYLCGYNMNYEIHGSSFEASGSLFGVSGDIMALYDYVDGSESRYREAYFPGLFKGCTNLVSAPDLPNIMPGLEGYSGMFEGCTNLRVAPALPAKKVTPYCYMRMFAGCTSLTMAPELPATSLDLFCYVSMFRDCTSLVNAPELPATSLADYCYAGMFAGCTRLKEVPELPATQLSLICYSSMFSGCSSLVNAPKIPATSLEYGCYSSMFRDCTSLVNAPELPATTLAGGCYESMFSGCTSLIDAPELPATTLAEYCYRDMFRECFNLKKVKCLATDISASQCLDLWLELVAETGTFIKSPNMNAWPTGSSGIPEGWIVKNNGEVSFSPNKYLTFNSEGTTKISLVNEGGNAPVLYYSTDLVNWIQWDYSEISFSSDVPLYLCGDNPDGFSSGYDRYSRIMTSGDSFSVKGDIMSLINCEKDVATIPCNNCFVCFFEDCSTLVEAPDLPASTLMPDCYSNMFRGCTSLSSAPELPATKLADKCYLQMFVNCRSLTHAPKLPATTLAGECYNQMFAGCTSLYEAPDLPATELAVGCYGQMFMNCTRLVNAPELPATALVLGCYVMMFSNCSSLNYIKCLATDISASNCLYYWVSGAPIEGVFVKAPNMYDWPSGSSGIPEGWVVVNDGEVPNGGNEGTTEEEWN